MKRSVSDDRCNRRPSLCKAKLGAAAKAKETIDRAVKWHDEPGKGLSADRQRE